MRENRVFSGERVVGAVVREILVPPDFPHDLHRFAEQLPVFLVFARVRVRMELRPLIRPDPPAKTDIDPPAAHIVQNG